jgi:triacylglycerol lipase
VTWNDLLKPGHANVFFSRDPLPPFDVAASGYSAGNAWWLAELSRLVYRRDNIGPRSRREFLRQVGFEEVAFFSSEITGTGALLAVARSPAPFAVLSFRGTEQKIQDFLHDADTWPVPAFGGSVLVHRGFKRALNSVWTGIAMALDKLECPVFYTGHSLGAALATLAALRRAPQAVYAYGSPRVGDVRFVERLRNVPVYRVVHGSDIVTVVPIESLGFRHAGVEHRIGRAMRPTDFNVAAVWNQLRSPPQALADHAPINYVDGV